MSGSGVVKWQYNNTDYKPVQLTPDQRKQQAEEIRQKKELNAKAEAEKHAQAAIKARTEWNAAKIPTANDTHDYAKKRALNCIMRSLVSLTVFNSSLSQFKITRGLLHHSKGLTPMAKATIQRRQKIRMLLNSESTT